MEILRPDGWPRPKGYSSGVKSTGELVFVAGQIGWDTNGRFPDGGFVAQARKALENVAAVLASAGARPEHVVRMTWYVKDMDEYRRERRAVGEAYRAVMGAHYPAMTLVRVVELVEPLARVEIEATAVIPREV